MRYFFIAAAFLLAAVPVFAQNAAPDSPYPELATMSGIVASTALVVEVLKRLFRSVPAFRMVPIWVYAMIVSTGLVLLARFGLRTMEGDIGPMVWKAALLAASSSGFFTWLRKPEASPKNVAPMLLLPCILMVGCADKAFLHAADAYHKSTESWLTSVEKDPDLTEEEKDLRRENWEVHGRLIEAKKESDATVPLFNP